MAAQGSDSKQKACPRCYAQVPIEVDVCPECGASIGEGISIAGADAAVYPELAKANLLRMRGEYRPAEEQCLSILRRYPNNASANILLGDICADRGDWDQAEQWYEMALDLDPDSDATREKLETVRQRLKRLEVTDVAEQLGLPDRPSKTGVYAIAALAGVVIIGFVILTASNASPRGGPVELPPVQARPNPDVTQRTDEPSNASPPPSTTTPDATQGSELSPFQTLAASNPDAGKLLNVFIDPRSGAVTVIFRIEPADDARQLAARLGRTAIERAATAQIATLRGMQNNGLVYAADVTRQRVEEVASEAWQAQNQAGSWVAHVLTGEWVASGFNPTPPAPTADAGAGGTEGTGALPNTGTTG